jgi:hypothetical protein
MPIVPASGLVVRLVLMASTIAGSNGAAASATPIEWRQVTTVAAAVSTKDFRAAHPARPGKLGNPTARSMIKQCNRGENAGNESSGASAVVAAAWDESLPAPSDTPHLTAAD